MYIIDFVNYINRRYLSVPSGIATATAIIVTCESFYFTAAKLKYLPLFFLKKKNKGLTLLDFTNPKAPLYLGHARAWQGLTWPGGGRGLRRVGMGYGPTWYIVAGPFYFIWFGDIVFLGGKWRYRERWTWWGWKGSTRRPRGCGLRRVGVRVRVDIWYKNQSAEL